MTQSLEFTIEVDLTWLFGSAEAEVAT